MKRLAMLTVLVVLAVACDQQTSLDSAPGPTNTDSGTSTTSPPPPPPPVPDVRGLPLATATMLLSDAGFTWAVEERYSHDRPGTVLSQRPDPGTIEEGLTLVQLLVAQRFPRIPDVLGKMLSKARSVLRRADFHTSVREIYSTWPAHTVISQSPAGGTEARPGRSVKLVVSTGPCTSGYSPCIPPGPDVDCAGGSGDGPRYVSGSVTVTGSDPYGLDGDNDGVGCE